MKTLSVCEGVYQFISNYLHLSKLILILYFKRTYKMQYLQAKIRGDTVDTKLPHSVCVFVFMCVCVCV